MFIFVILFFVFGLMIGSFLNVVILRFGTGFSIAKGRSICFSCGKTLEWWELIPVVSFFALRGRCGGCKTPLSLQYPAVELLTACLYGALGFFLQKGVFSVGEVAFFVPLFALIIAIGVYDLKHKIIPDTFVGLLSLNALLYAGYLFLKTPTSTISEWSHYSHFIAGPILFLPFFLLWFFSRGRWIGLGDGKLALVIGFLLGISNGVSAIALAFWVGAVVVLILLSIQKFYGRYPHLLKKHSLWGRVMHLTMRSEVPFAPFLLAATLWCLFYPQDFFSLHLLGI